MPTNYFIKKHNTFIIENKYIVPSNKLLIIIEMYLKYINYSYQYYLSGYNKNLIQVLKPF